MTILLTPTKRMRVMSDKDLERQAILDISLIVHNEGQWYAAKQAWLAGYRAAMKSMEAERARLVEQYFGDDYKKKEPHE